MTLFLTGATGYIGSYMTSQLLREYDDRLALLVRADSEEHAKQRLWKSLQLHMKFDEFLPLIEDRVDIYLGDLTKPKLGLDKDAQDKLIKSMTSVIHCAASLNRKSSKSCFNVNLRGTMHLLTLARAAHEDHGLRRFSDISTVAVCGHRQDAVVKESEIVDWGLSDYDPYARTKKFCEAMVHELLPDVQTLVFRPSIVLGDSRFPETTQFDMVRAFVALAQMVCVPLRAGWKADIVPADYVANAVVTIHQKENPKYDSYNLSSGVDSLTYREVVEALASAGHKRPWFTPWLLGTFSMIVNLLMNTPRSWGLSLGASLMKVFLPYLTFNTVFDNSRVVEEIGYKPKPFSDYAYGLLKFATKNKFKYPYVDWDEAKAQVSHDAKPDSPEQDNNSTEADKNSPELDKKSPEPNKKSESETEQSENDSAKVESELVGSQQESEGDKS